MKRKRPLNLEILEDRSLPALFGVPWPNAGNLAISFALDGTAGAADVSQLYQQLNAIMPQETWQTAILSAFQTWAVNADIDFHVVSDNGNPFGATGPANGGPGVGDIRVATSALVPTPLAAAVPFDFGSGLTGEVALNSQSTFSQGAKSGAYDLFSVMLHEAGHVLGMPHSDDPNSPMYEDYEGVRTGLTSGDIANLQALYGAHTGDPADGPSGNSTFAYATPLAVPAGGNAVIEGDVTSTSDVHYYQVVPASSGSLQIALRASDASLLQAQVTVYDASFHVLQSSTAASPLNNDLTLSVTGQAGQPFYVEVQSGVNNLFGIGKYRLVIGASPDQSLAGAPLPGASTVATTGNGSRTTASDLSPIPTGSPIANDVAGAITSAQDTHYYKVTIPNNQDGEDTALVASLWPLSPNELIPTVNILNSKGKVVSTDTLRSDASGTSLQVRDVNRGDVYYIQVTPASGASGDPTGNYRVAADFLKSAVRSTKIATGNLDKKATRTFSNLQIGQTELMHFNLSVAGNGKHLVGVQMVIFDANQIAVGNFSVWNGNGTLDVWLKAGSYTVGFVFLHAPGDNWAQANFTLIGMVRSDAIGISTVDPTTNPVSGSGSNVDTSTYAWTSTDQSQFSNPILLTDASGNSFYL